ncbi:MAG: SCO family protein [Allopontixanthobacter sediminis]
MSIIARRELIMGAGAMAASAALLRQAPVAAAAPVRLPVKLFEMTMAEARSRKKMRLLRDAMADRVVALNFMFTGCSSVCPMQSLLLSRTQKLMGRKMGREVVFLSISLSPISDTPDKLAAYAKSHEAGSGWYFLAGDFMATSRLQKGFDAFEPKRDDHPPVICIGKASAPRWSRLYGMPRPRQIASELDAWL